MATIKSFKFRLCAVMLLSLGAFLFFVSRPIPHMTSALRRELDSGDVLGEVFANQDNLTGVRLASAAMDEANRVYVVISKAKMIWVLVSGAAGERQKLVPVRRLDGRTLRYGCPFFSVAPDGQKWWTARKPYEERKNTGQWQWQEHVICLYSKDGKPLQEWRHTDRDGVGFLQSLGGDRAIVGGESGNLCWIYQLGVKEPKKFDQRAGAGDFISRDGEIWSLIPQKDTPTPVDVSVARMGQPPRVTMQFPWHPKRENSFPSIFWRDPTAGLFLVYRPDSEDGKPQFNVYNVDNNGGITLVLLDVGKLLEEHLQQDVVIGRCFKADSTGAVWFEAVYGAGEVTRIYEVFKVEFVPRWKTWFSS